MPLRFLAIAVAGVLIGGVLPTPALGQSDFSTRLDTSSAIGRLDAEARRLNNRLAVQTVWANPFLIRMY